MRFLAYICLVFSMSIYGMDFIDKEGVKCRIPAPLVAIFKESDAGINLKDDIDSNDPDRMVDFSKVDRGCLKGEYVNAVLGYAQNLESLTKKEVDPKEVLHLDAANYLGIQQKEVLYHLANRVWGYLRTGKQTQELKLSEFDEAYVRKIAKPYLHSPAKILAGDRWWFLGPMFDLPRISRSGSSSAAYTLDLSFNEARRNTQYYPLASLDGLQESLCIVDQRIGRSLPHKPHLNLAGNLLDEFIIDLRIQAPDLNGARKPFQSICLANNAIKRIAWEGTLLTWPSEPLEIDLRGNPIQVIDNSIYRLAYYYRCEGKKFKIIISEHKLSLQEIALAKRQWYLAVNTLVDRYSKGHNPDELGVLAGLLVTAGAGFADYALKSNGMVLLMAGLGGGMASWLTLHLRYLPRLAHMMAIQTHPDIEKPRADFHKPLGNTWLEDWQKPQLILNQENDAS